MVRVNRLFFSDRITLPNPTRTHENSLYLPDPGCLIDGVINVGVLWGRNGWPLRALPGGAVGWSMGWHPLGPGFKSRGGKFFTPFQLHPSTKPQYFQDMVRVNRLFSQIAYLSLTQLGLTKTHSISQTLVA